MLRRFVSTLVSFLCLCAYAQPSPPPTSRPLPLDPLTPAEVASAGEIVRKDQRVVAAAGDQPRVVLVQFIAPKLTSNAEPSGRFAEVVVHNDRAGGGARVLVNLGTSSVADVVRLTERNVPIGDSDVEMAASLALQSGEVQRLLGGPEAARRFSVSLRATNRDTALQNAIEGVSDRSWDPDDPCSTHRCVGLFFRSRGQYFASNQVTVDLTDRRVLVRQQRETPLPQGGQAQ